MPDGPSAAHAPQLPEHDAAPAADRPGPSPLLTALVASGPERILALQRTAGNQAVGRLLQRSNGEAAPEAVADAGPHTIGGFEIATYGQAAAVLRFWCIDLDQERADLGDDVAVPETLESTRQEGLELVELIEGGGTDPLDSGQAEDVRSWHADYVEAVNAARAAQAREAAARARTTARELQEVADNLEAMLPTLRDVQRAHFREGDEDELLKVADAIATVIDTALVAKTAIEQTLDVASELRAVVGTASASRTIVSLSGHVRTVLGVLEQVNRAWATFQLARTAVDLVSGSATEMGAARTGVEAMSTAISAGGTLLNASAGFTLYANLYIGPMTSACLSMLARLEDLLSRTRNRNLIELGELDAVNWSLEPGGRAMFDYMVQVMRAGSSSEVPEPPEAVDEYFVDREDEFSAGVGRAGGELPTEGWIFEETDKARIKRWVFANRNNLWGMLYGALTPPR